MNPTLAKSAQIHIRVTTDLKRAVKVHCAQSGVTEQAWVQQLIETALAEQAPERPPRQRRDSARPPRGSR